MELQIRLFDHLRVSDGALGASRVMRPRAQRLLVYLLLHRARTLRREQVAFALWPDRPEADALAMLRRALNDLRAALPSSAGSGWLAAAGGELGWRPDGPCWLDIDAYERLVQLGTPDTLQQATALYLGDLLAAWDEDWLTAERERLRQSQTEALLRLAAHQREWGNIRAALELTSRALALDPLSESIHANLMTLHSDAGDRSAALAVYDQLEGLLREELDVEPLEATQALRAAIAQGTLPRVIDARPAARVAALVTERGLSPLFGRDAEREQLGALWSGATLGAGRLAILSGDAGVGKSHLALSLVRDVIGRGQQAGGGLALIGHCFEFEQALPYQAIVEMLRSAAGLLRQTDLQPAHRAILSRLAPEILGGQGLEADPGHGLPADQRAQLFEALLQAFLALSRNRPLLLVIEDVHLAAESTLDWLAYITPRLDGSRMLVAITYRTEEVGVEHALGRLRQRLTREANVSTLALQPLSIEAHRELVAELSGLAGETAIIVADRLFQETAGNPFFLHEIVRGLIESGGVVAGEDGWEGPFIASDPAADVPLPDSLREVIAARLERLTEMARMFIRMAAVAGRVFEFEIVRIAGGWSDEHGLRALEDLLARGFLRAGEGSDEFAFAHHLVREAVNADLAAPRRAYCHRQLADALAQHANRLPPAQRQALAGPITHHALNAQNYRLVFEWAPLAAEHASGLYAFADAMNALDLASLAFDRLRHDSGFDLMLGERREIDVLLDRARLFPLVSRSLEEHEQVIQSAGELLTRHPDPHLQARYCLRQAAYLDASHQYERAAEVALMAHDRHLGVDDKRGAADSLYLAGDCKMTISQNRAGRRLFEQALPLYRAVGDTTGEAQCLSGLGWTALNLGEVEYALEHLNRALEIGERHADRLAMARACYVLSVAWSYYAQPQPALRFAEQALRLYREVGHTSTSYRPLYLVGVAHWLAGDLELARQLSEQALAGARSYHDGWLEGWASQFAGRLALERGDLPEAERYLRHAHQLRQGSGELQNQISDLTWLGRLRLAGARPDLALEHTSQAMARLESLWGEVYVWEMPDVFFCHAEALAATDDAAGARTYVQRAHETLMTFAAQIQDPAILEVFLTYPRNARIVAAWDAGQPTPGERTS